VGGVILILLGLAALAPACYTAWIFTRKFFTRWPGVRRIDWTTIGGAIAWLLIATSCTGRIDRIAWVMGAVFAPAVGAMTGDFLRQRGGWAGLRAGFHPPGMIAWAAGVALAPILELATTRNPGVASALPPSPIVGFLIAVSGYWLLAAMGLEHPSLPLERFETAEHRHATAGGMTPAMAATAAVTTSSEPLPREACRGERP
jgi:hypothetical protein